MSRNVVTVELLAKEADLELDEALVTLWDAGFSDVVGPESRLAKGEANRARRALGVATRREVAYPNYWMDLFALDAAGFAGLLETLDVGRPFDGPKLRKRTLNRLRGEARNRGIRPRSVQSVVQNQDTSSSQPILEWIQVGQLRDLRHLSTDEVRAIHFALVDDFRSGEDPIDPPGVRSETLLASAVARPLTSNGEHLKYPTVEMAAGALLHALVHDHPFHNGNKRSALVSMLVFLDENGAILDCVEDLLFRLVLQLAQHTLVSGPRQQLPDLEVLAVANWIHANSRRIQLGERPIKCRQLRQLLVGYGCDFEYPSGVGNRINIYRIVSRPPAGFLRRRAIERLQTQVQYGDDGREVQHNSVHKIRKDLELNDESGVDSKAFYDREETTVGEFIVKYRKTLRRLATL
jgi:prophage maintenance system killer protein